MKKITLALSSCISLLLSASCSEIPKQAYASRGQPEALLTSQPKKADFDLNSKKSLKHILSWTQEYGPSDAVLSCQETSTLCTRLEHALQRHGVKTTRLYADTNKVTFTYAEIAAHQCENRYIDNMINPYNLSYPTLGCSIATNEVMMVTKRRTFTNPDLMGNPDARKTVQTFDQYYTPSKADTNLSGMSGSSISSSGGGSGGSSR